MKAILAVVIWYLAIGQSWAQEGNHMVLGVIAHNQAERSVALLKDKKTSRTFAIRVGQEAEKGVKLVNVTRRYATFNYHGKDIRVMVGDFVADSGPSTAIAFNGVRETGFEREGNKVRVTSEYKEHLLNNELAQILMQAAAVPVYDGSNLKGFQLLEIDAGSIYEKVGLVNGDVVTAINGQHLQDVGMTIKMLHAMKTEKNASITVVRSQKEETIDIEVQ